MATMQPQAKESMTHRFIGGEDYQMISEWWRDHGWPVIPAASLPQHGIMIEHGGAPVCAGFLYRSDSNIAWIEWIVSDKKSDAIIRGKCVEKLVESLCGLADALGFPVVFSALNHKGLIRRFEKAGFSRGDGNMVHMVKGL